MRFPVHAEVRTALDSRTAQGMAMLDRLGNLRFQDEAARRLLWMKQVTNRSAAGC